MDLKIYPILNNVYYEWCEMPDIIHGIKIPDFAHHSVKKVIVHEVGPTCELVEKGDKVLTWKHTGVHLFLCVNTDFRDGERHRMCREDEFLSLYAETPEEEESIKTRNDKIREAHLRKLKKEEG